MIATLCSYTVNRDRDDTELDEGDLFEDDELLWSVVCLETTINYSVETIIVVRIDDSAPQMMVALAGRPYAPVAPWNVLDHDHKPLS